MTTNYIELVNLLRDRFNEVRLVANTSWVTAVGFDQFTKDAINYAYRDIINAELEWPFTHISGILYTSPGKQLYNIVTDAVYTTPTGYLAEIDTIDWDGFYIGSNQTIETFTSESHTIPSSSTYTVTVTNINIASSVTGSIMNFYLDQGVTINAVAATAVTGVPLTGQYSVQNGVYVFSSADAAKTVAITYQVVSNPPSTLPVPITADKLQYIDYDYWRQNYLPIDLNANGSNYTKPTMVFKPQVSGQLGISPVPDQVYNISCEFWLDGAGLSATTDIPLIPSHYWYIIIDGAQRYCYEFREDAQLATMADKRFQAGIDRMRIELINRETTMDAGFHWYKGGLSSSVYY